MRRLAPLLRAALLPSAIVVLLAPCSALAANTVQAENSLPGDTSWQAAITPKTFPIDPPIDGYAGATSVRPGGTIDFHVSVAAPARYRIEIVRLGWYGGVGGRRLTCLVGSTLDPTCSNGAPGVQRPPTPLPAPNTGEIDAGWSATDTLQVPSSWVSGYYLAIFELVTGRNAGKTGFTPFIVQAPIGDRSQILVVVPTNTWQAYNGWGGQDFYTRPEAVKVSFNRPFRHRLLFRWEYPLVRFLERNGYDVSYATDDDVDSNPSILLDHQLDMTAGHGEYWTKAERDGWEAARAQGANLAFMGANTGYWQVRYEDGNRTLVGYKNNPDPEPNPALTTTLFRDLSPPRPECALEGVRFVDQTWISERYYNYYVTAADAADPWFAGSGLTAGTVLPGLVGYEFDSINPSCHVPPVTDLLHFSGPPLKPGGPTEISDAVRYRACSGAEVFTAGSEQFSWGLDSFRDPEYPGPAWPPAPPASPGLQRVMTNAISDMLVSHVPQSGPPQICVPTVAFTIAPSSPLVGENVQFTSSSADQYGYIGAEQWQLGNNAGFTHAGSFAMRSFAHPGPHPISLRVTDTSGATATVTRTALICPRLLPASTVHVLGRGPALRLDTGLRSRPLSASAHALGFSSAGRPMFMKIGRLRRRSPTTWRLSVPRWARAVTVDVAAGSGNARESAQYLLIRGANGRILGPAGTLSNTSCDGSTAHVLTATFGGLGRARLAIAITAAGRFTVAAFHNGRRVAFVRSRRRHRRRTVVTIGVGGIPRGSLSIVITHRGERLVLAAARL